MLPRLGLNPSRVFVEKMRGVSKHYFARMTRMEKDLAALRALYALWATLRPIRLGKPLK